MRREFQPMNHMRRMIAVFAVTALFTLTALAQDPAPAASAAAPDCEKAKTEEYVKWVENYKEQNPEKQKVAHEAGKAFLAKCPGVENDQYVNAVKKWVAKYEDAVVKFGVRNKYQEAAKALNAQQGTKDYAPLFAAGKELAAAEPENLAVLLDLTNAGILSANKSLEPDTISYARRALALVEAGKGTPEEFKLLSAANKDEAVAALNYRLGLLMRNSSPDEAVTHLLKVAQGNSPLKSDPSLYFYLAQAYAPGYTKLAGDYNARFANQPETPESALAQAKLNQSLERILDAYARAIALNTKTDAASVKFKADTTATLTSLYKQSHNDSDAGLTEFISGSATRRLPLPSDPVPTPAAPATTTTQTTPATTPASTTPAPAATAKPTTPAPATTAKPTATPTPKP